MKSTHTLSATLLPAIWKQKYNVSCLLSVYTHNIIYELIEVTSGNQCILKILDKKYFHRKLYEFLSLSNCHSLLLPMDLTEDSQFVYLIYEYCPCLTDLLLIKEFSYAELSVFVQDIGDAILFLHENHITHCDIAPGNIFMKENGHFLLGDFSSSRFEEKSILPHFPTIAATFCKIKNFGCSRTGATPLFSPPDYTGRQNGYYMDCYGFAMILFLLLNELKPPSEENYAQLQPLSISKNTINPYGTYSISNAEIKKLLLTILIEPGQKMLSDFHMFFHQLMDIFQNTAAENLTFHTTIIKQENTDFFLHTLPLNRQHLRCKKLETDNQPSQFRKQKTESQPFQFKKLKTDSQPSQFKKQTTDHQPSQFKKQTTNHQPSQFKKQTTDNQPSQFKKQKTEQQQPKLRSINIFLYVFLFLSILLFSISFYRSLITKQQKQTSINQSVLSEQKKQIFMNKQNITSVDFLSGNHTVEILVLSENNITSVKPLAELSQLLILDLSCNRQLTDIQLLKNLQHLQQLVLTDTNTTEEEIALLKSALPNCIILY